MRAPRLQLLVIAKEPLPGQVKTRLSPPLRLEQAAELARAALEDTFAAVAAVPGPVRRLLVLDGAGGDWLPAGFDVIPQRGGGLDERLAAAYDDAFASCSAPALLIGMDTPQATPSLLVAAGARLRRPDTDAVLGDAADGGWWALGLSRPDPSLLLGVPMSTDHTGAAQRARLRDAGLRVADLPILTDVDTVAAAELVAAQAPDGAFARALGALEVAG